MSGFLQSAWEKYTKIIEDFNEPGRFTAFIGYEWTPNPGPGNNMHRNVVYRDDMKLAEQVTPFTTFESVDPEDLWKWMEQYEKTTGGKVLTLAHNGNMSNGIMFPYETNPATGDRLTGDYAKQRARWEPLEGYLHQVFLPSSVSYSFCVWGMWLAAQA